MKNSLVFLLVVSCIALLLQQHASAAAKKKAFIVYLGSHSYGPEATSQDYELATESHYDLLGSFLGSKERAQSAIFYSYKKNINGFAAVLDEEEALQIAKHPYVISVFPNRKINMQTTRSWSFLGMESDDGKVLPQSIWSKADYGEDVIIGNIDSGVWPESESFNDHGMRPVPARWKGFCQNNTKEGVPCNKKLIGARYFRLDPIDKSILLSTRDTDGHGTHTLSTVGGSFVPRAKIFGQGNGTAKGGSPKARLAAYKVCWPGELCGTANILAAFEAAIHDGVDMLSVSLVGPPEDYLSDTIAIGSFHAIQRGITVVCSGGNKGPVQGKVTNIAPWIITVAASTIDRSLASVLVLGNGKNITGECVASKNLKSTNLYPLINAADAKFDNASADVASFCYADNLDPKKVQGKIVVCQDDGYSGQPKATTLDNTNSPIKDADGEKADPFVYGAGHVSPDRAMDPGLVYDLTTSDYLNFLCASGYKSSNLSQFAGKPYSCPTKPLKIEDMNYPSIAVANLTKWTTVTRTLKNVGAPGTHRSRVHSPHGINVSVKPEALKFIEVGEQKSFRVTLQTNNKGVGVGYAFGELIWSDDKHQVRTPLVVNVMA